MKQPRLRPSAPYLLVIGMLLLLAVTACGGGSSILGDVSASAGAISPNGDGRDDYTQINYKLRQKATVSVTIVGQDGKRYPFRIDEARVPGSYSARFYGTYEPDPAKPDRHLLPDGAYSFIVSARDDKGVTEERTGQIAIRGGDPKDLDVTDVSIAPATFSPDGDGNDDESIVNYTVSKDAKVEVFATDSAGRRYLLEGQNDKVAGLYSHRWDGSAGGNLLSDGQYVVYVHAEDKSGNIVERTAQTTIEGGGNPKLQITRVRFSPTTIAKGGTIKVEIDVKNTGDVPLRTLGPAPGTPYDTVNNFMSYKDGGRPDGEPLYFERAGVWRVGVDWDQSGRPYPVRWGLSNSLNKLLMPGEEAHIEGTIQVLIDNVQQVLFWAGVEQGGRGFPGGRVGQKYITISY